MKTIKLFFVKFLNSLIGEIVSKKITELVDPLSNKISVVENLLTPKKVKEVLDPCLYEIERKGLKIRVEAYTPYRDKKIFHVSIPLWENGRSDFYIQFPFNGFIFYESKQRNQVGGKDQYQEREEGEVRKIIKVIFSTHCVSEIKAESAFKLIITKPGCLFWDEVINKVNEAIASLFPDVTK